MRFKFVSFSDLSAPNESYWRESSAENKYTIDNPEACRGRDMFRGSLKNKSYIAPSTSKSKSGKSNEFDTLQKSGTGKNFSIENIIGEINSHV